MFMDVGTIDWILNTLCFQKNVDSNLRILLPWNYGVEMPVLISRGCSLLFIVCSQIASKGHRACVAKVRSLE